MRSRITQVRISFIIFTIVSIILTGFILFLTSSPSNTTTASQSYEINNNDQEKINDLEVENLNLKTQLKIINNKSVSNKKRINTLLKERTNLLKQKSYLSKRNKNLLIKIKKHFKEVHKKNKSISNPLKKNLKLTKESQI